MTPRILKVALVCLVVGLTGAACGNKAELTPATVRDGLFIHRTDVPDMRLEQQSPAVADPQGFADPLTGGEVFKVDAPTAAGKLRSFGFVRGYLERFIGAGVHAESFVAEFKSAGQAQGMLAYMDQQLFMPCPNEPLCSARVRLNVSAIPGSKGQSLTVYRKPEEGPALKRYKVLFTVGPLVYGIDVGAEPFYDPGTPTQDEAIAVFQEVYDRVKGRAPADIFKSVPATPLGPQPPGAPPPSPSPSAS